MPAYEAKLLKYHTDDLTLVRSTSTFRYYIDLKKRQLVKVLSPSYKTKTDTESRNDIIVQECIGSDLIRLILGFSFASLNAVTKVSIDALDCDALVSSSLIGATNLDPSMIYDMTNTDLLQLAFVADLLGIANFKEHIKYHYTNTPPRTLLEHEVVYKRVALVDCAVTLNKPKALDQLISDNSLGYEHYGIILKIFNRIIATEYHLFKTLDRYEFVSTSGTYSNFSLKERLSQIVEYAKNSISILEGRMSTVVDIIEDKKSELFDHEAILPSLALKAEYVTSFENKELQSALFFAFFPHWHQASKVEQQQAFALFLGAAPDINRLSTQALEKAYIRMSEKFIAKMDLIEQELEYISSIALLDPDLDPEPELEPNLVTKKRKGSPVMDDEMPMPPLKKRAASPLFFMATSTVSNEESPSSKSLDMSS
jgi:hypothetical protein